MNKHFVVGLTGQYATGKSTVTKVFEDYNYQIIDVDILGHRALIDKRNEIIKVFGENILDQNGFVDRKRLGSLVFKDEKLLIILENIVHPWMINRVEQIIKESNSIRILINAAILIKMKLNLLCNRVILLSTPEEMIIQWAMERDKLTENEIKQRLKNQLPVKLSQSYADYHIENNGNLDMLTNKARQIIDLIEQEIVNGRSV
ncbi:MAG: dephospho-CoA kinase [Spirochaetota bacterium]|nr:dephospho-CoA kinase [Spirochaetota bacterium]